MTIRKPISLILAIFPCVISKRKEKNKAWLPRRPHGHREIGLGHSPVHDIFRQPLPVGGGVGEALCPGGQVLGLLTGKAAIVFSDSGPFFERVDNLSKLTQRFNATLLTSKLVVSEETQIKPGSAQGARL